MTAPSDEALAAAAQAAGLVYLVNEASAESAGFYDPKVADVLLRQSQGWSRADPATGVSIPSTRAQSNADLVGASADASTAAAGGQVPSDTPAGAPADNPKE
jgi:hypothetical protein